MRVQRAIWRAQTVGGGLLGLLLVAAVLGAFSQGVLSSATAVSDGGKLAIDYQRLLRNGASESVTVRVEAVPRGEALRIRLSHGFLEAIAVESVTPPPPDTETNAEGAELIYPRPAAFPARIHLSVRPQKTGFAKGAVMLNGAEGVQFSLFVYP